MKIHKKTSRVQASMNHPASFDADDLSEIPCEGVQKPTTSSKDGVKRRFPRWEYKNDKPSRTKKEFAEETNVHSVLQRYAVTGQLLQTQKKPMSGDFTWFSQQGITDKAGAKEAQFRLVNSFNELPQNVRAKFKTARDLAEYLHRGDLTELNQLLSPASEKNVVGDKDPKEADPKDPPKDPQKT